MAKSELSTCVDFRALMDSWWDWNSRTAARLNLWTSTLKVIDWFMKPGKYSNWKQNLPRFQPTTFYGSIYATQGPMQIVRNIANSINSASCSGTKPRGSSSQNCRIWACDQWLPHFLGISDGDIPVLVRRYSSSDRRAKLLRA